MSVCQVLSGTFRVQVWTLLSLILFLSSVFKHKGNFPQTEKTHKHFLKSHRNKIQDTCFS